MSDHSSKLFRRAIASGIADELDTIPMRELLFAAEAVLERPEMQAIGAALAQCAPGGYHDDSPAQEGLLAWRQLPASVQSWALACVTSGEGE